VQRLAVRASTLQFVPASYVCLLPLRGRRCGMQVGATSGDRHRDDPPRVAASGADACTQIVSVSRVLHSVMRRSTNETRRGSQAKSVRAVSGKISACERKLSTLFSGQHSRATYKIRFLLTWIATGSYQRKERGAELCHSLVVTRDAGFCGRGAVGEGKVGSIPMHADR
jgi:hypothetical protein